jgi:hypothetical protein
MMVGAEYMLNFRPFTPNSKACTARRIIVRTVPPPGVTIPTGHAQNQCSSCRAERKQARHVKMHVATCTHPVAALYHSATGSTYTML